jgi:hypothetical protein
MAFAWLLELPANRTRPVMYLHPARGDGVCGFTFDACDAQRFVTKEEALAERDALNGALGAEPAEHGFIDTAAG